MVNANHFVVLADLSQYYIWWFVAEVAAVAVLVWFVGFRRFEGLGNQTIAQRVKGVLDARANNIQEQLQAAERSREEAARIQQQAARDMEQARQQAEDIVTRAGETSQAIQRDMEEKARAEYERIVGQARTAIEYEREQAELRLRQKAADIVIDAAREVVERNRDPEADRKLIDDSLSHMRGM